MERTSINALPPQGAGADPRPPQGALRPTHELAALMATAAGDLGRNAEALRVRLQAVRECLHAWQTLPLMDLHPHVQALDARSRRLRTTLIGLEATLATAELRPEHSRHVSLDLSTLNQDVDALSMETEAIGCAAASCQDQHAGNHQQTAEMLLALEGMVQTLDALYSAALLHAGVATELEQLLATKPVILLSRSVA